mmetsp:Transcript_138503/g.430706  ORF Transcript_138503/g.430706 Transcript_138503/m.430706 type:complete len:323 (+) Transcript_138503:110-1078(+)
MASGNYGSLNGRSAQGNSFCGDQCRPAAAEPPPEPEHSILRSGNLKGGRPRSRVNVWELVLVPWAFLVLILFCYLLGGAHGKPVVLWVIPVILIALSSIFVRHHYRLGNNAEVVLGVLCVTAVMIGLVVGSYSVVRSLSEYYRLSQGASYFNVLPSEPALGKRDATTLVFTNTTAVDPSRTLGYVDVHTTGSTTYCVAPISNGDEGTRIQYWAAGTDCCERRGNFQCGAATNPDARGAVVWTEATQKSEGFKQAIEAAEAAYFLTSGDEYLLVEWHKDPVGFRDGLWNSTVMLFTIFGGVYLLISSMVGCALMPVVAGALVK